MNKNKEITEQPRTQVKNKKQKYSKKYVREIKKKLQVSMLSIVVVLLLIVGGKLAGLTVPINTIKTNEQTKLSAEESKTVEEEENIENKQSNKEIKKIDENGETTEINKETTGLEIKETAKESEESIKTTVNTLKLQDTETVTYIYNIDDLVRFRDNVNAGNDYAGKTVYVMEDIDMSPACSETVGSWTPIGTDTTIFAGTFDGNYHTLSNLYYNSNAYNDVGLFAKISPNAMVQNIVLKDIYINNTKSYIGQITTGAIAGISLGKINNVGVESGSIIGNNTAQGNTWSIVARVGGIVGCLNDGNINCCYNKAKIYAYAENGMNDYKYVQVGGIAGISRRNITNSYNIGTVNAFSHEIYVGGIAGRCYIDDLSKKGGILNSYNIGFMGKESAYYGTNGYIGGIAGMNDSTNYRIEKSYYSVNSCTYSCIYRDDGSTVNKYLTEGKIEPQENLQTYAPTLGTAYENDDFNINGGYPILWWEAPTIELNKKQAYIQTGEQLQLEINATVGARRTVPTTRECFNY